MGPSSQAAGRPPSKSRLMADIRVAMTGLPMEERAAIKELVCLMGGSVVDTMQLEGSNVSILLANEVRRTPPVARGTRRGSGKPATFSYFGWAGFPLNPSSPPSHSNACMWGG